jgi:subtilisin family serine protease
MAMPDIAQAQSLTAAQLRAQAKVRVVVAYKSGAEAAARAAIAAAGGRVVVDLSDDDALSIELPARALLALQRHAAVDFVEDDPVRYAFGPVGARPGRRVTPAAGGTQTTPYGIPMVQSDQLSDSLASVRKLCIVDSGIDRAHEDLSGITVEGVNLTTSGDWFTDENSHGTHVAGTIAAIDNTLGVVGVLPHRQISLYIAKVFDASGSAPSSVIGKAMQSCLRARSNVVSMSLGGPDASRIEQRIADRLAKRNVLVIAAAGNGGTSDVEYPAGFASVVSVAAIDSNKVIADFSQFNADVELAGPGVDVISTVPVGSQIAASLTIGASPYSVLPIDGSPKTSASGPLADFGTGEAPAPGSMTGKICLIARGNISFADKVVNCQTSGGLGAVIYNNTAGVLNATLGDTVTTIPSVSATQADGATMLTQVGQQAALAVFATLDAYASYSGTSMATPHVSGVAALVWSYFTHCTASQIRDSLDKSAQDLGDPGRDIHYGFGLVQAKAAHDRINTLGCGN